MAQLIVRRLEKEVVQKLREQAAKYGISMEEQHRRLLRETLLAKPKKKAKVKPKMSFLDYLSTMPNVGKDSDFRIPRKGRIRDVDLSD
jgi:plasmid stability protein